MRPSENQPYVLEARVKNIARKMHAYVGSAANRITDAVKPLRFVFVFKSSFVVLKSRSAIFFPNRNRMYLRVRPSQHPKPRTGLAYARFATNTVLCSLFLPLVCPSPVCVHVMHARREDALSKSVWRRRRRRRPAVGASTEIISNPPFAFLFSFFVYENPRACNSRRGMLLRILSPLQLLWAHPLLYEEEEAARLAKAKAEAELAAAEDDGFLDDSLEEGEEEERGEEGDTTPGGGGGGKGAALLVSDSSDDVSKRGAGKTEEGGSG